LLQPVLLCNGILCCLCRVMLQGHLAAALTAIKCYLMLFLQSDAGEVRRRAARKAPRGNNSPTKGLLTTPGDLYQMHCSNEQDQFTQLSVRQLPWPDNKPGAVHYYYLIIWLKKFHIPPLTQVAWFSSVSKHHLLL